ncbi:hypothetical protein GCM10023192_50040 [Amycolatopsis samaneae]
MNGRPGSRPGDEATGGRSALRGAAAGPLCRGMLASLLVIITIRLLDVIDVDDLGVANAFAGLPWRSSLGITSLHERVNSLVSAPYRRVWRDARFPGIRRMVFACRFGMLSIPVNGAGDSAG